ncbi:MAG: exodeoxyribonuclease III [Acidimicrobiales bacterium]|nr:exodeoxyribonuclease III [Acidimicrobiales bacterium]
MPIRVATWNVNSLKARLGRVEEWLATVEPDVCCLQETKLSDDAFPAMTFQAMGYESVHVGQGRWNGVAILSRLPISDVVTGFGPGIESDPEARLLWARCGPIRVASLYAPNGRSLDSEHYEYKLSWYERLLEALHRHENADDALVLCGDFNIAPDDRDVYDPDEFVGSTHVSEPERAVFRRLLEWGLVDVFREHYDAPGLFSWWDYRAGNFHKGKGMRIDLVLASRPVAERSTAVLIDRNARKGKQPSDHAPVVADFDLEQERTAP